MRDTTVSDYDSVFAKQLRNLLEKKSISKTRLAIELGVKQQTISQWADGSTTPALKHLKPLASYFNLSIDELVTGVAIENEDIHLDTGLSNQTIEKLKKLNAVNAANDEAGKNRIIIEFLNIVIEGMDTDIYNLSRLARQCMEYIIGMNKHFLWLEKVKREAKKGWEHLYFGDGPNFRNDKVEFNTYKLVRDFERFIEFLAKDPKVANRAKKIYVEHNLNLPDYSDNRSKPGAIFGESVLEKYPAKFYCTESNSCNEASNRKDNTVDTLPD